MGVTINPEDWKPGSPIYYGLAVGNDVFGVLNGGSGYSYNANNNWALTSAGEDAIRFEVRSGDQNWYDKARSTSERSEISSTELLKARTPIEVSYDFMLEPGAANTASAPNKGGWLILGQFMQDTSEGQTATGPSLAVTLIGEKMSIDTQHLGPDGQKVIKVLYTDTADIQRGHTYSMDIKTVFDANGNGRVLVIRDGVVIVDYAGVVGYGNTSGFYWKEGIYRSPAAETIAAVYSNLEINHGEMVSIPPVGAYVAQSAAPTLSASQGTLVGGTLTTQFAGTAAAGALVTVYLGEKAVGSVTAGADGHYQVSIAGIPAGSNLFTATATDAAGRVSKVSGDVVIEVGTAKDILAGLDLATHKADLAAIYITDSHVFTVGSIADMKAAIADDQSALQKIVGGYSFQFWSGLDGNRTLSRYDASGTFASSYNAVYDKSGVLIREIYVDATPGALSARDVYQYNVTGKSYVASHQSYDAQGKQILSTTTYANGVIASSMAVSPDGTTTTANFTTAGLQTSSVVTTADGTSTATSYTATGLLAAVTVTRPDKSVDTKAYTNGVLTNEYITHAAGSEVAKETFTYNIVGQSFVTTHQSYSASNTLLSEYKLRADGSIDTITWLASDNSLRTKTYDASHTIVSEKITLADKSSDLKTYTAGVLTREVITKVDGSKETWDFNIAGKTYGSLHRFYDAKGKQTGVEYVAAKVVDTQFAPLHDGTEAAPTLGLAGGGTSGAAHNAASLTASVTTTLVDGVLSAALTGKAAAGAAVMIYDGDKLIGTTIAGDDGSYSFRATGLGAGKHVLSASTIDEAGRLSKDSSPVVVHVMTSAEFVAQINLVSATVGLAGIWLTDTHVLTVPAGRLGEYVSKYGAGLDAIAGGHTFETWSGTPENRTVSRYDASGSLQESVTKVTKDGALLREVVVHHDDGAPYAREVTQYIPGKSWVSSYQAYDEAGKLVLSTRSHADGTLDYHAVRSPDGTDTMQFFDAKGVLTSTIVLHPDGSSTATTVDSAGHVTSLTEKLADLSSVATVYKDGIVTDVTVVHVPGAAVAKDTYSYGIKGADYVSTHNSYDAAGKLVLAERFGGDGHVVMSQVFGADGSSTKETFDGHGDILSRVVQNAAGSAVAKDVFDFRPVDTSHVSEHVALDAAGRQLYTSFGKADGGFDVTVKAVGVTVASSAGDDHFKSASGDTFVFKGDFGHDTIESFRAGTGSRHDVLQFEKGMFAHDNPIWSARDVGDDVVITTLQHDSVTLLGIHKAALVASDFLIV